MDEGDHSQEAHSATIAAYHQAGHAVALYLTGTRYGAIHTGEALDMPGMLAGVGALSCEGGAIEVGTVGELIASAGVFAEIRYLRRTYGLSRDAAWAQAALGKCATADLHLLQDHRQLAPARRLIRGEWSAVETLARWLQRKGSLAEEEVGIYGFPDIYR